MADMNQKRRGISNSSVILNNQIWVCGGHNGNEWLKSVEMYDPETDEWKYMKQMNECRWNAAAAVVNGKIFCSGGSNAKVLNSVECYDPSSDVWTLICDIPQYIYEHAAAEIDGHFIVMGGIHGESNVWALDTTDENAKWIHKPSMLIPRYHFSIAKIDGEIFICGGWGAQDNVEIFNGEVWRNGPKMPTRRVAGSAVVIPRQFAKKLVNSNNIVAEDLTGHNNDDESLFQTPLKKPNRHFHIPNSIELSPEKQTIILLGGTREAGFPVLNSLLVLENNGQNWKELNIKLPHPAEQPGAQFLNNNLYIFGGSLESSTYKEMNEGRMDAAAAVVNGKIFCSGGSNANVLNSVECYDPSSNVWTLICNMPQYIDGHCAVEIDGDFILMGGWNTAKYLKNVWALDTTNKNIVWVDKPSMPIPRSEFSIAKINNKIFVCGGETKEHNKWRISDTVDIFDGKVWSNGPKIPMQQRHAPAVVIPMQFVKYLN